MDLRDNLQEQIKSLIDWMDETVQESTPSAKRWEEKVLELKERAWFLREIVLPKIPAPAPGANHKTIEIGDPVNSFTPPERHGQTFLRTPEPEDVGPNG